MFLPVVQPENLCCIVFFSEANKCSQSVSRAFDLMQRSCTANLTTHPWQIGPVEFERYRLRDGRRYVWNRSRWLMLNSRRRRRRRRDRTVKFCRVRPTVWIMSTTVCSSLEVLFD